jgi:hypothetical protein
MEIVIAICFVVFIVILFSALFVPLFMDSLKAGKLIKLNDNFTCKCGGVINDTYLSYPFIKFEVKMKSIKLSYLDNEINISLDEIREVSVKKGIFSYGIIFEFKNNKILLWTSYYRQIYNFLESRWEC